MADLRKPPSILPLIALLLLAFGIACTQAEQPSTQGRSDRPGLIAFSREGRIGVMQPDGKAAMLSAGPADFGPVWSPDGKSIAFMRFHPAGDTGTYVMKADGTDARKISPAAHYLRPPVWSPDSQQLLVNDPDQAKERFGLWIVKADGSSPTRLVNLGPVQGAAWAPDGKTIAFTFNPAEKTGGLYLISPAGGEPALALDAGNGGLVQSGVIAWSPDGTHIAVRSTPRNPPNTDLPEPAPLLTLVKLEKDGTGSAAQRVNTAQGIWQPSWAPDSQKVGFIQQGGSAQQVAVLHRDSGKVDVAGEGSSLGTPVWSPDGTQLLAAFTGSDQAEGKLRRLADGKAAELATGSQPAWSAAADPLPSERPGAPAAVTVRRAVMHWTGWD